MFENLMQLNSELDAVIEKAQMETERMEMKVDAKIEDAFDKLANFFDEMIPIYTTIFNYYGTKKYRSEHYIHGVKRIKKNDWGRDIASSSIRFADDLKGLIVPKLEIEIVDSRRDDVRYDISYRNVRGNKYYDFSKKLGMCNVDEEIIQVKEIVAMNVDSIIEQIYKYAESDIKKMMEDKVKKQKELQDHFETVLDRLED